MGLVAKSVRETVTGFNPNLPTEQQSEAATNVAKYQRSLARRRSLQTERPLESMINLNAQSKWERFEKRVFAANEESRANLTVEDRQGFVEIITVAATNHRKSQRAMLEPLNLVTEPSL